MQIRSKSIICFVFLGLFLCIINAHINSCTTISTTENVQADSLNVRAYKFRYANIDSSLKCTHAALSLSQESSAGQAFALNNLAYVAYQQMRYGNSIDYLDKIYRKSGNQVELLCADVMYMKVAQRTGQGLMFFKHRNTALRRLERLAEEESLLTEMQRARLTYARSELHIVSSTYYFYYGQAEKAITEINQTYQDASLPTDTAQWLYYRYMLGSGGLIQGSQNDVILQEFDHLFAVYTTASPSGLVYFLANALQSMATLLDNPDNYAYIVKNRSNSIAFLQNQHKNWHELPEIEEYARLSLVMADRALHLFRDYKDLFQLACAYRTVGEIYFRHGMYNFALQQFTHALDLVESQKQRSKWQVPFWTFSMREYLSLTYSALGDKQNADFQRNAYLDFLEQYTQDYELEERKQQLEEELRHTRVSLVVLIGLIFLSVVLLWLLIRRMHHQSRHLNDSIFNIDKSEIWNNYSDSVKQAETELKEIEQELEETILLHQKHIREYRHGNVERRAKVSLVYAIIPYLDRIIAEVNRMQRDGETDEERLRYISELSSEIMRLNDVLTDWIQMRQGQFKLHITTFPLQQLFDIIAGSRMLFTKKGITLTVDATEYKVKADMALTLFMINTLCDNARKFTPAGGNVSISAVSCADYVEVSVTDSGVGLSEHDVEVLNQSKIYDPSQLGEHKENKGFGFGIMNCKGIIGKYKKTSKKFNVCEFGVESKIGQGSRFWFRLPGVIAMLLFVCTSAFARSENVFKSVCDSLCRANIAGNYQEAYTHGESFLKEMPHPVDTPSVIYILNEMAVSALSLKQWDNYYACNKECVRLHNIYTADDSLPAYCEQMEQMKNNNVFVYAFLVLSSVLALVLFYLLSLRGLMRRDSYAHVFYQWLSERITKAGILMDRYVTERQKQDWRPLLDEIPEWIPNVPDNMQELNTECSRIMREGFYQADKMIERMDALTSSSRKLRYEEDRLYVMNQVLDNCLSTIKHETMYYPARTQQLVEYMRQTEGAEENQKCLNELTELVHFYRNVYVLLYQQAERQTEQNNFYREQILLSELDALLPDICVIGDRMLLSMLMQTLKHAEPVVPILSATRSAPFVYVRFEYPQIHRSELELENLFQPVSNHIPFLIAKQIIREHDTYTSHSGLRLIAEATADGYCIQFTLLQAKQHL